jgi:curli biogenesis system outer membrane secretion channel CsgG
MKKIFSVLAALLLLCSPVIAEKVYRLDDGILAVAKGISAKLPAGTKVVVLDIKADRQMASDYIMEELTADLLDLGKLVLVDRKNLDEIRQELALQVSGDVSDDSAQRLGAMLGAEVLITGSFDLLNDNYRMPIKAVRVETSEILYITTTSISSSSETEALLGKPSARETAAKTATSVGTAVGTAARNVADFSGRLICSAVNPVFGLGSYMQGDTASGGTIVFWEIVGTGAIVWGEYRVNREQSWGQQLVAGGSVAVGLTVIYAFIRPWTYNRNPKVAEVLDNVTVTAASANNFSLGYTVKY